MNNRIKVQAFFCLLFFGILPANAEEDRTCQKLYAILASSEKSFFEKKIEFTAQLLNRSIRASERERLSESLIYQLSTRGIQAELPDSSTEYLRILPSGEAKISRLIKRLNDYGIEVRLAADVWEKSNGAYLVNENAIYIDLKTLADDKLSSTMAHEIRHAMNAIRSEKPERSFERAFQTVLQAPTLHKTIPGTKPGPYSSQFSLDEILAHRQGAKNLVKEILGKQKRGENFSAELEHLRDHARRFQQFVDGWQSSAKILEEEIVNGSIKYTFYRGRLTENYKILVLEIEKAKMEQGLVHAANQDPTHVGMQLDLLISNDEYNVMKASGNMEKIALSKIKEISSKIQKIDPAVRALEKAFSNLDGKSFSDLDEKLTELSRALATLK